MIQKTLNFQPICCIKGPPLYCAIIVRLLELIPTAKKSSDLLYVPNTKPEL